MKRVDFYNKKVQLHEQMIDAICEILDKNKITEIDFTEIDMCGGYVCTAIDGPAIEQRVLKLRHTIGTCILEYVPEYDENHLFNDETEKWLSLNDDVLYASFDTVYDAVYDLLYNPIFFEERKRFHDTERTQH